MIRNDPASSDGAVIREAAVMEDGAKLEDLSLLPEGATIPRGERWAGSPARPVEGGASFERRGRVTQLHAGEAGEVHWRKPFVGRSL